MTALVAALFLAAQLAAPAAPRPARAAPAPSPAVHLGRAGAPSVVRRHPAVPAVAAGRSQLPGPSATGLSMPGPSPTGTRPAGSAKPATAKPSQARPGASVGALVSKTSVAGSTPAPVAKPSTRIGAPAGLRGIATWYAWRPGQAAAGPALRAALGPRWRGRLVRVCSASACVSVRLTDFMASRVPGRLVDLDSRSFASLAPLSRGVLKVEVSW